MSISRASAGALGSQPSESRWRAACRLIARALVRCARTARIRGAQGVPATDPTRWRRRWRPGRLPGLSRAQAASSQSAAPTDAARRPAHCSARQASLTCEPGAAGAGSTVWAPSPPVPHEPSPEPARCAVPQTLWASGGARELPNLGSRFRSNSYTIGRSINTLLCKTVEKDSPHNFKRVAGEELA